jgi:hypothetical protein
MYSFFPVNLHMPTEVVQANEFLQTHGTHVRLNTRVREHVDLEFVGPRKLFITVVARQHFTAVLKHVHASLLRRGEALVAHLALEV